MKNMMIVSLVLITIIISSVFAFDPPKGLRWGMSYEQAKAHLQTLPKHKTSKLGKIMTVKNPSKLTRLLIGSVPLVEGILYCDFKKNIKIADQKIHSSYLYFHPETGLCSVWYQRRFTNEDRIANKLAWSYFKQVYSLLALKYGRPPAHDIDLDTPHFRLLSESPIRTKWISSTDSTVISLTLRKVKSFISYPAVEIQYLTADYYKLVIASLKKKVDAEDIL